MFMSQNNEEMLENIGTKKLTQNLHLGFQSDRSGNFVHDVMVNHKQDLGKSSAQEDLIHCLNNLQAFDSMGNAQKLIARA